MGNNCNNNRDILLPRNETMQAGRRARRVLKGKAEKSMARDRPSSWGARGLLRGEQRGCLGASRARASTGLPRGSAVLTLLRHLPQSLLHPRLAPVKALPQPIPHHTAAAAPWRWALPSNTSVLLQKGANDFADSFLAPSEAVKPRAGCASPSPLPMEPF